MPHSEVSPPSALEIQEQTPLAADISLYSNGAPAACLPSELHACLLPLTETITNPQNRHAQSIPLSSSPRRPARPLIWMYSPDVSHRKPPPSNFLALVKTTVLAGMFRPVEKVSVANSTYNALRRYSHPPTPCMRSSNTKTFGRASNPPYMQTCSAAMLVRHCPLTSARHSTHAQAMGNARGLSK